MHFGGLESKKNADWTFNGKIFSFSYYLQRVSGQLSPNTKQN